jgi:hypothetical protein
MPTARHEGSTHVVGALDIAARRSAGSHAEGRVHGRVCGDLEREAERNDGGDNSLAEHGDVDE